MALLSPAVTNAGRTTTGKKKKQVVSPFKSVDINPFNNTARTTTGSGKATVAQTPKVTQPTTPIRDTSGGVKGGTGINSNLVGNPAASNKTVSTSALPGTPTSLDQMQGNLGQDYTGWASGMRPEAAQMMFQEPQALLRQVMAKMGMSANDNPGMYYMGLPNADLANALALVGLGGNAGFQSGDINSVINNMGDFFQQQMTRGGQGVDFNQGINNIKGAGADTALGGYLNLDDPRGQYQALSSLVMPLAEAGLHPLFAKSLQNQMERIRDEYYQRYAYGKNPPASMTDMLGRLGLGS